MKQRISVVIELEVELDESKFTPEFMEEFRTNFYNFNNIDKHAMHLGWLYSRGIIDEFTSFIEGYGDAKDFGIKFRDVDSWCELSSGEPVQ